MFPGTKSRELFHQKALNQVVQKSGPVLQFNQMLQKEVVFLQFNKILFLEILTSVLYSAFLILGLFTALTASNFLFNLHLDNKVYFILLRAKNANNF